MAAQLGNPIHPVVQNGDHTTNVRSIQSPPPAPYASAPSCPLSRSPRSPTSSHASAMSDYGDGPATEKPRAHLNLSDFPRKRLSGAAPSSIHRVCRRALFSAPWMPCPPSPFHPALPSATHLSEAGPLHISFQCCCWVIIWRLLVYINGWV
jgi:hypothetical protein